MNSYVTNILCLLIAAITSVIPAFSFDNWFKRWDANHDGQWSWSDFRAANRDWSFRHRRGQTFDDSEIRRMFRLCDRNGDGHVSAQDVQFLHKRWN